MNCLQNLPRSSVSPLLGFWGNQRDSSSSPLKMLLTIKANYPKSRLVLQVLKDVKLEEKEEEEGEEKQEMSKEESHLVKGC